jgi:hypothetical protein
VFAGFGSNSEFVHDSFEFVLEYTARECTERD